MLNRISELAKQLRDSRYNLSDAFKEIYLYDSPRMTDSEFLMQIKNRGTRRVIAGLLADPSTPQGFVWRILPLVETPELLTKFIESVVLGPTITLHKHMVLPRQLYEWQQIPISLLHSVGEYENDVRYPFNKDLIPYNHLNLGSFDLLSEFEKWSVVESYLWGMKIPDWNSELKACYYWLLNNAALMGFINSELVFASNDSVFEIYSKWFELYKASLTNNAVALELVNILSKDPFSHHFGAGLEVDYFGFTQSQLPKVKLDMAYYDYFGFPYGNVQVIEQVFMDDTSLTEFDVYRKQSYVFLDHLRVMRLQALCKRTRLPLDVNVLMNPELTSNLASYLLDILDERLQELDKYQLSDSEYEYCFDRIVYSVYSLAHRRYNDLKPELLNTVIKYSFNKKYKDAYGDVLYGSIVEAQNVFSESMNVYLSSVLSEVSDFPYDFDPLLDKYKGYTDVLFTLAAFDENKNQYDLLDRVMHAVTTKSDSVRDYVAQMSGVQKALDVYKQDLSSVVETAESGLLSRIRNRLFRPSESENPSNVDGVSNVGSSLIDAYSVLQFVDVLAGVTNELLAETLVELQKIVSVSGYGGFSLAMDILQNVRDTASHLSGNLSPQVVHSIMSFVRCCATKSYEVSDDDLQYIARLDAMQIDFLSSLVLEDIDISSYIRLPKERLQQYSELTITMPDMFRYINVLDSSDIFDLVSCLLELSDGSVIPVQEVNSIGSSSKYAIDLLETGKVTAEQLYLIGYDKYLWRLLHHMNSRLFNFRDVLRSMLPYLSAHRIDYSDGVVRAGINSFRDLYLGDSLRVVMPDEDSRRWYKGIVTQFSLQYIKSIPYAKNMRKCMKAPDLDLVTDTCSDVAVITAEDVLGYRPNDRYLAYVYTCIQQLLQFYALEESEFSIFANTAFAAVDYVWFLLAKSSVEMFLQNKLQQFNVDETVVEWSKAVAQMYNKNGIAALEKFVSAMHCDGQADGVFSPALDLFMEEAKYD